MRKAVLNYLVVAVFTISVALTSCGGGGGKGLSGKGLSGTYIGSVHGVKTTITFSGDKIEIVGEGEGQNEMKGIYELVEEYKEDGFSRGKLVVTGREGQNEMSYVLEGKILTFNYEIFIKEGTKSSKEYLNGVYEDSYNHSITFTGNKFEWDISGTYELFVAERKGDGRITGAMKLTFEQDGKNIDVIQRYQLEGDKLNIRGVTYTKK